MPLYEYLCDACGKRFEKIQKFSDPPLEECALCGKGPIHKQMSSPAIQFKGSGWYITDYAKKGSTAGGESGASGDSGAPSEKADKPAEKTESKSSADAAKPAPSSTKDS
jgi:putative FmdB family regulatory protein